jgi:hypothetical protein
MRFNVIILFAMTMGLIQSTQLIGQNSREYRIYYPVELQGAWSRFMNSNAVWVDNYQNAHEDVEHSLTFSFNASYAGDYVFEYAADNHGSLIIDGIRMASFSSFNASEKSIISLKKGQHKGKLLFSNAIQGGKGWWNNPAGVAMVISDKFGNVMFTTRDQSVIGLRMKKFDTVTLQITEYSCGDCCYLTFKDVVSGDEYYKDHFDTKSKYYDELSKIADVYYRNVEDEDLQKRNMFYTAYIEYRRPEYKDRRSFDEWGCFPEPLSKKDKTKSWMINNLVRK